MRRAKPDERRHARSACLLDPPRLCHRNIRRTPLGFVFFALDSGFANNMKTGRHRQAQKRNVPCLIIGDAYRKRRSFPSRPRARNSRRRPAAQRAIPLHVPGHHVVRAFRHRRRGHVRDHVRRHGHRHEPRVPAARVRAVRARGEGGNQHIHGVGPGPCHRERAGGAHGRHHQPGK